MATRENWKAVVGFEGRYEVSDLGRVRSVDHVTTRRGRNGKVQSVRFRGRELRPGKSSNGYLSVAFWVDGKHKSFLVQVLVLEAFIGPRPVGAYARHLNDVRIDNRLGNLAWGTPTDNRADADRNGKSVRGEGYSNAKLTEMSARVIRRLKGRVTQSTLAEMFLVSAAAIQAVHDGRTWTHV